MGQDTAGRGAEGRQWSEDASTQRSGAASAGVPLRSRSTVLAIVLLWLAFYGSFTLFHPALLDDADSVHAEVAREMIQRHDWVTLYANGIRYLEKAPLLYWSMAASYTLIGVSAAAARLPLAFAVLALAFAAESLGRRMFRSPRAGLYTALMLLSSFGIFIFSRITIPDVAVCLWLTLAMVCYWASEMEGSRTRWLCYGFAVCCALNVLTKGLIGIVFPLAIVGLHLLATRGWRGGWARLRQLHPWSSAAVFLAVAVPWHVLAALANPTEGHPGGLSLVGGHWTVPLPTDGNVHGWLWFYFVNEQVLRYLNLRVPRDYDTVPLALFWGLNLVWLMPWSAFLPSALAGLRWRRLLHRDAALTATEQAQLLLVLWAGFVLVFFSFSTRQEYYVLPALPALALLIAGWLVEEADEQRHQRSGRWVGAALAVCGSVAAVAAAFFALHGRTPAPGADLASLLDQNPGDYALSFGHFLDLSGTAMGAFRLPLALTAIALSVGTLAAWQLRRRGMVHRANLVLFAATFGFLIAAHMGLSTFAPVLSSRQLAAAIAPQPRPAAATIEDSPDVIVINGEYESASTLGFYLRRRVHILNGRSSNLWYGSFFTDAPPIYETTDSFARLWMGPRRVFLWQTLSPAGGDGNPLPSLPGPIYTIARSGGKEILSNEPDR